MKRSLGHVIGKIIAMHEVLLLTVDFYGFTYITPARRELEKFKLKKNFKKENRYTKGQ